ncbi:DeoR/GlpR family DNA-binding transcription regulator [Jiangella rhizosphaerae]|uniref:DeoR/GlpR family DNA-binding transcription regulator n=1 Tax=Jiangella rhizosphaerae TaxID=2293569 RepID=UPI0013143FF5|nr:DeoR/GlpR family DNA-binding transcription regulator [Jiangella rhizosphaerae]
MRYTDAPRRRDELLRRLRAAGYLSAAHAAAELDVSEMTIRRDLRQLALDGLAVRVTGGARLPGDGVPFELRTDRFAAQKSAVARAVADLLPPGATVALDSGTTVARLADLLPAGLTVVTHSVPVVAVCATRPDLRLIGLGGVFNPATRSFGGPAVRGALEDIVVDIAVLSATAVGPDGVFCADPYDAETKRALAAAARSVVVAADGSKLAARAPIRFAPLDVVSTLVTDSSADSAAVRSLEAAGVRVSRAAA